MLPVLPLPVLALLLVPVLALLLVPVLLLLPSVMPSPALPPAVLLLLALPPVPVSALPQVPVLPSAVLPALLLPLLAVLALPSALDPLAESLLDEAASLLGEVVPVAELSVAELSGAVVAGAVEPVWLGLLELEVPVALDPRLVAAVPGWVASRSPGVVEPRGPSAAWWCRAGEESVACFPAWAEAVATASPEEESAAFRSSADALVFASTAPSSHPASASPPANAIRAVGRAIGPAQALGRCALAPPADVAGTEATFSSAAAAWAAAARESGASPVMVCAGTVGCTGIVSITPPPPSAPEAHAVTARS
ncbi:hypothetical protein [Amycolatopsis sp. NBC_01480]|uniref:hypothetical protein n=1 Tax=Amycolatopsis sp. NBC_01480 TaxID=2903562 RepID=UPI002E287F39|nr:hypothetical protein [Amycolatopsis sp. NBC_01480]